MRKIVAGFAIAAVLGTVVMTADSAVADDTGVAQTLHAIARIGGRKCTADHFHDGSGSGRTQAAALRAAISAWAGFTAWEYGSSWGSWGLAARKSVKCDRAGGGYSCDVSAIPCRY